MTCILIDDSPGASDDVWLNIRRAGNVFAVHQLNVAVSDGFIARRTSEMSVTRPGPVGLGQPALGHHKWRYIQYFLTALL